MRNRLDMKHVTNPYVGRSLELQAEVSHNRDKQSIQNCSGYCSLAELDYYRRTEITLTTDGKIDMLSIAIDREWANNALWKRSLKDSPTLTQLHYQTLDALEEAIDDEAYEYAERMWV